MSNTWNGVEIPHAPIVVMGDCDCVFCCERRTFNRTGVAHKAVQKAIHARNTANEAEKELLLMAGWEEQATHDGVTWWYRDPNGGSDPQDSAVRLTLMGYERSNRA